MAPLLEQLRPACQVLEGGAFAATAGRRDRMVLVTSPSAGEGSSLVAVNLALALCQAPGRPVLLVDGAPDRAGAARALGWPAAPGLSDVLAGDDLLEEVVGQPGPAGLSFMPPGRPLARLPELLAGRRLLEVMRALLARTPAGLVVIDGPPLLSGVAAAALAAYAGQVVLLVAAGRTSEQAIAHSLKRLGERRHLYCLFARPGPPVDPTDGRETARALEPDGRLTASHGD